MTSYNIPKQLSGHTEAKLKTSREKFGFKQADNTHKNSWVKMLLAILKSHCHSQ